MADQQGLYTLVEASELTGVSVEALRLRIKRGKLASERGNDGHPRVRLTDADLAEFSRLLARRKPTLNRQDPTLTRQNPTDSNIIKALEEAVGILREQLGRERERSDRAEAAAAVVPELRERAGRAEGEAATLRAQKEADRERVARLEGEQAAVRAELESWTAGGPFTRAWRAFAWRRG